jgi:hypothetical protein
MTYPRKITFGEMREAGVRDVLIYCRDQAEFDAIRDRLWRSWLPPVEAVRELTRAAVALPDENDGAWQVLEARGISRGVSGLRS